MRIPPFSLERYFEKFEFSVPYMLAASDCESLSIDELLADDPAAAEGFKKLELGYTEPLGHPELRTCISGLYEHQSPESIIVCTGAEEAIFLFMNAILSPGDRVIIHTPCYQSLHEIPRAIGCEVAMWPALPENAWTPDLNQLEDLITARTRMLVINSPHNPTGFHFPHDAFHHICEMAIKNNILLFSDEVYRFLEHHEKDRLPAAADVVPGGVSLGVLSKSFGLAGLRIGWIATGEREIVQRISTLKDYTTICNAAPAEYLAITALKQKQKLLERNRVIMTRNLKDLKDFFYCFNDQLAWVEPRAGCVAMPWFHSRMISRQFYETLALNQGILLLPGSVFGLDDSYFRIGFGRRSFSDGLRILTDFMKERTNAKKNRMD